MQCSRSRLPSVPAAVEEVEKWSCGSNGVFGANERGCPRIQFQAVHQPTKGWGIIRRRRRSGLVSWWRRSACSSSSRALSVDVVRAKKLDRRGRRAGGEGQVAWGLMTRAGE